MQLRCQAILFDLDGVLVDSRAVIRRHWSAWAERNQRDLEQVLQIAHGRRPIDTVRELVPDAHDHEALAAAIVEGEATDAEGLVQLGGVRELIESLPAGFWTVATSGPRPIAEFRLRFAGINIPQTLVTAEDVTQGKPDPQPYLEAARRLSVSPGRCVVIEDAPAGVKAGVAAGATVIALATTHPVEALREAGAQVLAKDLAAIRAEVQDGELLLEICPLDDC